MIAGEAAMLTVAQMAAADRLAIATGRSGAALMEAAGAAVAETAERLLGPNRTGTIVIACGPGNNGGDGLVAGRLLRARGLRVAVGLLGPSDALTGDAAVAWRGWNAAALTLAEALAIPDRALIVDALFGAGLSRPLTGEAAAAVERINAAGCPILAVDVPSGLDGDTGLAAGPVVTANETTTFFRLKPGHLLLPGRTLCGAVRCVDIGIGAEVLDGIGPALWQNGPSLWQAAWPRHGALSHKFTRGAVAVLAGGVAGVGAPRLSARAALRVGAGLATLHCAPSALAIHAARGPDALMQRSLADAGGLAAVMADDRLGAILAGPALGLDPRAEQLVATLIVADIATVLDADALTLLGRRGMGEPRPSQWKPLVLTPHDGEFRRLFGSVPAIATERSKLERARAAARHSGAIVIDKGADTVIAGPDGRAAINATGSAALATAGAGDVLAGLVVGLLVQGMPAFEAAAAAVWLHGLAGEACGFGLIADDLPEAVPALIRHHQLG